MRRQHGHPEKPRGGASQPFRRACVVQALVGAWGTFAHKRVCWRGSSQENGRQLTTKEAFRRLAHQFHGITPGKKKLEKMMVRAIGVPTTAMRERRWGGCVGRRARSPEHRGVLTDRSDATRCCRAGWGVGAGRSGLRAAAGGRGEEDA
eukprot:COSAG01_NODE_96_length_26789_cov_36.697089_13_plen_149_part_00